MSAPKPAPVAPSWLDGLLGAVVAATLLVTPLFFNPRTDRVFEPDKLAWVIALAILAATTLIARAMERPAGARWPRALRGAPAVAAVGTLLVLAVGTLFSLSPSASLWGSYRRGLGLLSGVALVLIFAAAAHVAEDPLARDRLRRALLLPAAPAGIYALLQRFGIDTIPWSQYGDSANLRAFASLGNAIFLGAWLAMVAPLAATGLAEAWQAQRAGRPGATRRLVGHAAVLILAVAGLLASGSRGPVLGLLAGLGALALWWVAASGRPRRLALVLLAALAAPLGLVALGRAGAPGLGRFAGLLAAGSRTARQRLLAWDALADAAAADPLRALVGHGPETVTIFLPPFAAAELTRLTPTQVFDRSHNVVWEWWVAGGLLGIVFWLGVQLAAFGAGYRALGWLRNRSDAAGMSAAGLGGAAVLAALGALWAGPGAAVALLSLGLAAGLVLWGAWRAMAAARADGSATSAAEHGRRAPAAASLLAAGLLAGLCAHLVEGTLGLPTAPAEVFAWVSLALLAALAAATTGPEAAREDLGTATATPGRGKRGGPKQGAGRTRRRDRSTDGPHGERVGAGAALAESLPVGLGIAALLFAPIILPFGATALFDGAQVLVLLLPVGLWLADDWLAPEGHALPRAIGRLAPSLVLLLLLLPLRAVVGGPTLAFALLILLTLVSAAIAAARVGFASPEPWRYVPYAALALLSLLGAWWLAIRPVLADAHLRAGLEAAVRSEREPALAHYERAATLWPSQAAYRGYVAGWYREQMVASSGTPAERRDAFGLAFEQLEAAEAVWPVASSARRLGVLHRDLGDVAPDAESRALSWAEAQRWLDVALERDPHGIETLVERGRVLERLGLLEAAAADHARAAGLDPGREYAWAGYARALLATGDLPGGVAAIDEALTHLAPDRVLAAASAPLPAPWVRELGPPIDAMARGALLVIARTRVEGVAEGKAARAQLDELDASSSLALGLRDWLDAGAPAFAPAQDDTAPRDGG